MSSRPQRARNRRRGAAQRSSVNRTRLLATTGAIVTAVVVLAVAFMAGGGDAAPAGSADRFMHLHGLAAPGWAPDRLYISTHAGLIEVDEAGEWRFVSEQRHDFMGFAHHPRETGTMFSSGHPASGSDLPNPIGFMRSDDEGVSWQPVSLQGQVDFHVMSVSAADPNVVYGWNASGEAGLYRSTDGGRTWERPAATGLMSQRAVYALAPDPTSTNRILAGTSDGLWESTDGGESWKQVVVGVPFTAVEFTPASSRSVIAYVADGQTGLVHIDDVVAAPTSSRPLGLVLPPDDAVLYIAGDTTGGGVMYAGTAMASLFRTADGGGTWGQMAREGERIDRDAE